MRPEDMDLTNEDDVVDETMEDYKPSADEGEQEQQHDWKEQLKEEVEEDEEESEPDGETIHMLEVKHLDEKLKEILPGLTSRGFVIRLQATKDFRHLLKGDSGGLVLQQYVQASPVCIELLEAWKLGIETQGVVPIFLLISEILQHPAGKDVSDHFHKVGSDTDFNGHKVLLYVRSRLDKLARTIIRTKMKDVYSQITCHEQKRQNAALLLMAAIVRRGRVLASEVATGFDFTLKVLPKLAQSAHRKVKPKNKDDDNRPVFFSRRGFIEFAMSFLEVSNPNLLRWVLQIRPLYAGVLRSLGKDDDKTISYVLTIMQEKVLSASSMVPPGLRSAVFGDAALEQLSVISADSSLGKAADIAHHTLMMLCTDPSHGLLPEFSYQRGISIQDTSLQRGNPARLLRLMLRLRSTEVDNHRNLLLAIVNERPSLTSAYMESFPYSLEPRESLAWFAAISLLSDLICAAKVSPPFSLLAAKGLSPPSLQNSVLQSRLKCILPRSFSRVVINRGLLHTSMLVKHASLRVLLEALSSLECLLNEIVAAVQNLPEKEPAVDVDRRSLPASICASYLAGVHGLCDISIFTALSSFALSESNGLVHAGVSIEPLRQKWMSLRQEIQDEIRVLLPDPQVLLSLISSFKTGVAECAGKNKKRECISSLKSFETEITTKNKRRKWDLVDQNVEICVSRTKAEERKDITEESIGFHADQDSDNLYTNDEDMITIAQIWGAKDIISYIDDYKDNESLLRTKVFDALALYQRTLPIALVDCSFDAFKLLPDDPLLLSSCQQQSLLSLLIDSTGGFGLCALGSEGPGSGTVQTYKYLQPLLKLMLYSSVKDIRTYSSRLAYRAMLSTCAFERNKGEVEMWVSFLPVHKSEQSCEQDLLKGRLEIYSQESSADDMSAPLASSVIAFLCDAVSTVGKNLYKYLDTLQSLLSKLNSNEDLVPPHFSPLVICILEKCLRVVESSSKNLKLAQRTVIAIYVSNVLSFLLQSQVNSGPLAFIITTILSSKFQKACRPSDASETFLCEQSPLKNLLLFAQSILVKEQIEPNSKLADKWLSSKGIPSVSQSLSQVLAIINVTDFERLSGESTALTSSIVCAMPAEILENFPSLVSICLKIFEKDYSILLALFCAYRELFGQVTEVWPDVYSSGLELAACVYSGKRRSDKSQDDNFGVQDSSVDSVFDACSEKSTAIAFASFVQSVPFFTLFSLSVYSYNSSLLGFTSLKGILEAKIPEVSSDSYVSTLHLILFWIQQIEFSWKRGAEVREQIDTCFSLFKQLLIHVVEATWNGHYTHIQQVGLNAVSVQEVVKEVLAHPALNAFMSPWMYSSFFKTSHELGPYEIDNYDLQCERREKKGDETTLEMFLNLSQERVHPIDSNILHILKSLVELASSRQNIHSGKALKQWDSFCRTTADCCRPYIFQCLSIFKSKLLECIKAGYNGIPPLPSFYILSALHPFVSPFTLLELVHWLFSNNIWNHLSEEASSLGPKLSYASIGLYFVSRAFDMLHDYLNQANANFDVQYLFWDIDGQKFDANIVREVYKRVIKITMQQNAESSDVCLLSILKAVHVQRNARIPPCLLPVSIVLSHLINITPTEIMKHCLCKTNYIKAKILLLLTEISTLHLAIFGQLFLAAMSIVSPFTQMHLGGALMIKDKMLEESTEAILSENEYVLFLPVTLRYLTWELRRAGALFLEPSEKIAAYYFQILWKGFMKWDDYTRSDKIFGILECDEGRYENAEDFIYYFNDTLLGRAVCMLQACISAEKISKKRRKNLLSSLLPKNNCLLDHLINDINSLSFEQLLNMGNRIVAKVTLVRSLLFLKCGFLSFHLERKSVEEPANCASECSQEKIIQSEHEESKMDLADYARFMNCLIFTLHTIFPRVSVQPQAIEAVENRDCLKLMRFVEKTLLSHLVDVSREIGANSIEMHYLSSLKAFTKSTLLHRFEDYSAMKVLRCLILVLSQENHTSNSIGEFAADALEFLMAHSQFVSTILWTGLISVQSLGLSDKGTMFRSLTGILQLVPLPSCDEEKVIALDVQATQEKSCSQEENDSFVREQRKLEVVKLLRVLYLLRVREVSLSVSVDTDLNSKELLSLLLAGYSATMKESDLEIFNLMHEIDYTQGSSFSGLSEMNYLWGEAALKRRREQNEEKLLSEYNSFDQETAAERQKRQFRENLMIDPKVCGDTVLYFPSERNAWAGPIELVKFVEESLNAITLEMEERPSLDRSNIVQYDPAFILQFSIFGLSVGYIESMEFARLGLLGLAFASISSSDESMRKLGYDVLGRYKQTLETARNFKGKLQLLLLLTYVKNAIVEPWQKIPSVLTIFVAEASCIVMEPTHNLYSTINRLLMRAPALDIESIPLFHSMFGSGSVHFHSDRVWILRLVAAGLNSMEDTLIYRRKFVLEVLMSFYGSSLADFQTKLLVLQIVKKAVKRRALAQYLVEHAGLLLWLSSAALKYDETDSGEPLKCIPLGVSIIMEAIHDLLSWRSIIRWLLTNGLEQLSQIASLLHWFLVYGSRFSREQAFTKFVLQILISTIGLSQRRKIYQTHFCLCFEGLFQVIQFIEHGDPHLNSMDIVELGLKTILTSSPSTVNTVKDKLKLLKLGMWAISSALQGYSLSTLEDETSSDKHWKLFKDQQSQETLMEKLLRWLAASVILGKISITANKIQGLYCAEKPKPETLFSFQKYFKMSSCLPAMEADPEIDKGLAHLILYLQQLVGVRCRVLSSVVAAVGLLLISDGTSSILDGTSSHHKFSSLVNLLSSEVSCPAEANPWWQWSFNSPWRDRSSKISDVQRLYEYEVCQILLISFWNVLSGTIPDFHSFTQKQMDLSATSPCHMATELCQKLDALKVAICKIMNNG